MRRSILCTLHRHSPACIYVDGQKCNHSQSILLDVCGLTILEVAFAATSRIIFDVWYYSIRQYVRLLLLWPYLGNLHFHKWADRWAWPSDITSIDIFGVFALKNCARVEIALLLSMDIYVMSVWLLMCIAAFLLSIESMPMEISCQNEVLLSILGWSHPAHVSHIAAHHKPPLETSMFVNLNSMLDISCDWY